MTPAEVSTRPNIDPVAKFSESHRQLVLEAVEQGHIRTEQAAVTIRAKSSPTKKDEVQPYTAYFALTARGMSALCNGKIVPATPKPETGKDERTDADKANGATDYFNYGFDLDLRQPIRVALEDSLAGPEKAIDKSVKSLVDGGLMSESEAREFVIAQRIKKGLPV